MFDSAVASLADDTVESPTVEVVAAAELGAEDVAAAALSVVVELTLKVVEVGVDVAEVILRLSAELVVALHGGCWHMLGCDVNVTSLATPACDPVVIKLTYPKVSVLA